MWYNNVRDVRTLRRGRTPDTESEEQTMRKQKLLILLCCLLYAFAWLGKYNYNANILPVVDYYGVSQADAGLVGTYFFVAYAVFQMIDACFCKRFSKRWVIAGSLVISSVINLILFFRPPFESIRYLVFLNGVCQAPLWPMLLSTLGEALDRKMMDVAVIAMSFSVLLGNVLIYGGSSLFNLGNVFQAIFLFSAILMLLAGAVWFFSYRALAGERAGKNTSADAGEVAPVAAPGAKPRGTARASVIGILIVCSLIATPASFVKNGLNTWTPNILNREFGFGSSLSIAVTLGFSVFGMLGSALSVRVNKRIRDFRALSGFFFLLIMLFLAGAILSLREKWMIPFLISVGCIASLTYAILNALTSIMPLELRESINPGFLTGLMNSCASAGGAISTYAVGSIADRGGWNAVFWVLLAISAVSTALPLLSMIPGRVRGRITHRAA